MPYIASLCRSSGARHQPVSEIEIQQSPSERAAANSTPPARQARNGRVVQLDCATWHAILSASSLRAADLVSHSMKEPAHGEQDAIAA
jgi:hypothetical protein